jgi:hypothetical protein
MDDGTENDNQADVKNYGKLFVDLGNTSDLLF